MQEAVPVGLGSMSAVLGTKIDIIKELISLNLSKDDVCEIANDNSDGQVIISGKKESVERVEKVLKEKKIKSIQLKVSAPFHCTLMKPAAEYMTDKINNVKFKKPKYEIISNVTADPITDPEIIKQFLIKQIYSSVKWRESILRMSKEKVRNFIEIGPGKVLTGMVKRTIKGANCFSINSIADIKNLQNEFKR